MRVKRYRYRISVIDPDGDGFGLILKACGVLRFHLRKRVDELLAQGYDREASILIDRDPPMTWETVDDRRYWKSGKRQKTLFGDNA